jgi:hypothetical protein
MLDIAKLSKLVAIHTRNTVALEKSAKDIEAFYAPKPTAKKAKRKYKRTGVWDYYSRKKLGKSMKKHWEGLTSEQRAERGRKAAEGRNKKKGL